MPAATFRTPTSSSSCCEGQTAGRRLHHSGNPTTALDELLVFDISGDPNYRAIVPGGGTEPGETVEEAARREALEEAGIDVGPVRDVGVLPGSHFVQAWAVGPTGDEWEHHKTPGDELVRCRWVTIRPGLEVSGDRGAFIDSLIRRRAVVSQRASEVGAPSC